MSAPERFWSHGQWGHEPQVRLHIASQLAVQAALAGVLGRGRAAQWRQKPCAGTSSRLPMVPGRAERGVVAWLLCALCG